MPHRSRRERKADERAFARIYLSVLGLGLAALMLVLMARGDGTASAVTGVIAAFGVALGGFALFAADGAVDWWADSLGGDEAGLPALLVAIPIYWLRKRLRGGRR